MRKLILLFCLTIITPSMDLIEFKKSILKSNFNIDTIEVSQLKNDTSFFFVNIVEEKILKLRFLIILVLFFFVFVGRKNDYQAQNAHEYYFIFLYARS